MLGVVVVVVLVVWDWKSAEGGAVVVGTGEVVLVGGAVSRCSEAEGARVEGCWLLVGLEDDEEEEKDDDGDDEDPCDEV